MASIELSPSEIERYHQKVRQLCNKARFDDAFVLSSKLKKDFPDVLLFAYLEAVLTAEDNTGHSSAEIRNRYRRATRKLKPLLKKMRGADPNLRSRIRNEYYWFSHQPYKQYLLGKSQVGKNNRNAYYSQGVGAVELAKQYGLKGKDAHRLKWARKSEKAWKKFFAIDPNWFNSYYFYAMSLALQGCTSEAEAAIRKMCKIAGKPMRWELVQELRAEIARALKEHESSQRT